METLEGVCSAVLALESDAAIQVSHRMRFYPSQSRPAALVGIQVVDAAGRHDLTGRNVLYFCPGPCTRDEFLLGVLGAEGLEEIQRKFQSERGYFLSCEAMNGGELVVVPNIVQGGDWEAGRVHIVGSFRLCEQRGMKSVWIVMGGLGQWGWGEAQWVGECVEELRKWVETSRCLESIAVMVPTGLFDRFCQLLEGAQGGGEEEADLVFT